MYQLVIADDEEVIRQGLAELVDWQGLGFELAACLCDGSEVMQYLRQHQVDVVFTDIRMNGVSGIELARYIAENKLPVKVVLLSGYKEFEYARQAITCGVESYLLKPTRFDEVVRVFTGLRGKLDNEAAESKKKKQFEELLPLLREQLVADLFCGGIWDDGSLDRRLDALQIDTGFRRNPCGKMMLRIVDRDRYLTESWQYGKETLKNAVENFMRGEMPKYRFLHTFSSGDSMDIIAVSPEKVARQEMETALRVWAERIHQRLRKEMRLDVEIGFPGCYDTLYDLAKSEDTCISGNADSLKLEALYRLILSKAAVGEPDEANRLAESLFDRQGEWDKNVPARFMELVSEQARQLGISLPDAEQTNYTGLQAAKKATLDTIGRIGRQAAEKEHSPTKLLVEKARKLIEDNYDRDISLEEIAERVFLNPAYLSRIFKQQEGESFTDYLTKVRISKAEELLTQKKYKLEEISAMTGYKNSRYFCKVFRLQTGMTPKEYAYRHLLSVGGDADA